MSRSPSFVISTSKDYSAGIGIQLIYKHKAQSLDHVNSPAKVDTEGDCPTSGVEAASCKDVSRSNVKRAAKRRARNIRRGSAEPSHAHVYLARLSSLISLGVQAILTAFHQDQLARTLDCGKCWCLKDRDILLLS